MSIIVAATGHRPNKLGGYDYRRAEERRRIARGALTLLGATEAISGMALGWDVDFAQAAIDLGIPVHAAVPFEGQECRWPSSSQQAWRSILAKCASVTVVSPGGYSASAMQVRNEWMVDRAPYVLALWDGSPGGTGNCVKYARQQGRLIVNVWSAWAASTIDRPDNIRVQSGQIGG